MMWFRLPLAVVLILEMKCLHSFRVIPSPHRLHSTAVYCASTLQKDHLKEMLQRRHDLFEILRDCELNSTMRYEIQVVFTRLSQEASHVAEELGEDGREACCEILDTLASRISKAQDLSAEEVAQRLREAEARLGELMVLYSIATNPEEEDPLDMKEEVCHEIKERIHHHNIDKLFQQALELFGDCST